MLLRLITVISLILFMLLMISGMTVEVALYRSLLAFMMLFAVVYLAIFMLNVLREDHGGETKAATAPTTGNNSNEHPKANAEN